MEGQEYRGVGWGWGLLPFYLLLAGLMYCIYSGAILKYTELCMRLESVNTNMYIHTCMYLQLCVPAVLDLLVVCVSSVQYFI